MGIFRRKTIFHVEESMPDPEELKIRFRRRILIATLVGFFLILSVPVIHTLKPQLHLRNETRILAEKIMEARLYSMQSRMPISLQLDSDNQSWKRIFHIPGIVTANDCFAEVMGPYEVMGPQGVHWNLRLRKENGEEVAGRILCVHPLLGILLDSTPLNQGTLIVTATAHTESGGQPFQKGLAIGQFGTEINLINQ